MSVRLCEMAIGVCITATIESFAIDIVVHVIQSERYINHQATIMSLAMHYLFLFSALSFFTLIPAPTDAGLSQPTGRTLLTVTGKMRETNAQGRVEFDRALLEQLGLSKLTTRTPWTEGEREFVGVSLTSLLDAIGVTGSTARAVAANDYVVDIPINNLREANAFLAMSMDGKQLRLRDKGPLWIIYPWSQRPELNRSELYSYAVWQLQSLHIE